MAKTPAPPPCKPSWKRARRLPGHCLQLRQIVGERPGIRPPLSRAFHEPPDLFAAHSFDAARSLLDALQPAGTASRDALGKELAHLEQFDSVTGPLRWKERQPRRRVFLMALENNRPSVVSTLEPAEN